MQLLIFDLDGTLTDTTDVDSHCYVRAWHEAFGIDKVNGNWGSYEHVSDEAVARQLFETHFGRSGTNTEMTELKNTLSRCLEQAADEDSSQFAEITGARDLINTIKAADDWCAAVGTGAWRVSAELKIQHAGLPLNGILVATAEDGPTRVEIVSAAKRRVESAIRAESLNDTVLIGDGVWDVQVAKTLGHAFIGVGTGQNARTLKEAGAPIVIEDYRDAGLFFDACGTAELCR